MVSSKTNMKWNTGLYDDKHNFVFKYGEDLVDLLKPVAGERILDLGCGTGYLTNLIAQTGASVIGIDSSEEMIAKAKKEYPNIEFKNVSATEFKFDDPFDAIFSNAVLHWVAEKEKVIECMYNNLKQGGRIVIEFGGKDNVKNITDALKQSLINFGYTNNAAIDLWYYPSVGEYTSLLEAKGFTVNYTAYYKRETLLKDKQNGIKDWIKMFGNLFLKDIDDKETEKILDEVQKNLRATNFRNNEWYADYKRLRIIATK